MGTHNVASMVVFEGGAPKKSDYRRFRIRDLEAGQADDFAAMNEVLTRRAKQFVTQRELSPYDKDRDASFAALPNVIVIDGGKGQLQAGLDALQLLQRIRDEAHRFAITHHRSRRDKAMTESILDDLPGVGPTRKRALLKHFGSPDAVVNASREDLEAVPGLPAKVGRPLYGLLHKTGR